jgi:hypothetical protein
METLFTFECPSRRENIQINGIGQKLAKNHHVLCDTILCAHTLLFSMHEQILIACLLNTLDVNTHQTFSLLLLPCIQDAEFMELEAMEPKDRSGAPHLVLV